MNSINQNLKATATSLLNQPITKRSVFEIRNRLQVLLFMRQSAPVGERSALDHEVLQLRSTLQRISL